MLEPKCALCLPKYCHEGPVEKTKLPEYCPMRYYESLIDEIKQKYGQPEIHEFFLKSALTEKEAYDEKAARKQNRTVPVRPRIREIAEFAKKIEADRIGMAFCSGLSEEASRASKILEKHDLNVISVSCCCGAIDKTDVGVPAEYKVYDPKSFEASCNPLLQAELLNQAETAFNVLIGLCVGHDMLFTKYAKAPVTTLIVKDRMTGHNPVISLYSRYFRHIV